MKRKYIIIFLMGLLYLIGTEELFSQNCIKMLYDKNGNRISFMVENCNSFSRGNDEYELENIYESEEQTEDLLVYPNPNDGRFRIELAGEDEFAEVCVYDSKGLLINSRKFMKTVDLDISNNPAGAYLLRIVRDNNVNSKVVVKH